MASTKLPKEVQYLIDKITEKDVRVKDAGNRVNVGSLLLYGYDAKHHAKLEVWDALPLVILLGMNGKYMWGINLHFIPYLQRLRFIKYLLSRKTTIRYREIKRAWKYAKIPMSYARLSYRKYLIGRVLTNVRVFHPDDYLEVTRNVMPDFQKQGLNTVYRNIEKALKDHRESLKKTVPKSQRHQLKRKK